MTPPQHFIISWVIANTAKLDRRSRICVTLTGLLPDLDGLGYVADKLGSTADFYFTYHHILGHNLLCGVLMSGVFAAICTRRAVVFGLCVAVFHVHLMCDLVGSMGPDGYQWPVYYWYPFNPFHEVAWSGQWELDSWRNSLIGFVFFVAALVIARYRNVTFFELVSTKLERVVLEVGRQRGFFKAVRETSSRRPGEGAGQ